MYNIIMSYAQKEMESMGDACFVPTVFKASDGGYELWSNFAAEIGRAEQWVAWSEDESCQQRNTINDVIDVKLSGTNYCELAPESNLFSTEY